MSLRAVDTRFLLPMQPGSACVIGDLAGWRAGLSGLGVELVDAVPGARPDLAVAPTTAAAAGLAVGATHCLLLGGDVTREVRSHGLEAEVYLAVPDLEAPEFLVPIAQRKTVRYFYDILRVAPERARWYRNRVAGRVGLTGHLLRSQLVTVVGAELHRPFGVTAAADASGFEPAGWLLSLGQSTANRRVVLSVFDGTGASPRVVAKLDRLPRRAAAPDRDNREGQWLADLASKAPLFGEHIPHPIADVPCGMGRATVESAAVGHVLTDFLRGPFCRRRKVAALEEVAAWLVAVAGVTAHREPSRWPAAADRSNRDDPTPEPGEGPVVGPPMILEHGDLWSGNVVYRKAGSFTVIDWADADPDGLPLRDLLYFLSETLALVDGATTDGERDRHFGALCRGELPSSVLLFRWVRALVAAVGIESESVGPLASWCWEDMASRRRVSSAEEVDHTVEHAAPKLYEPVIRRAEVWRRDPRLGSGWTAWND